MSSSMVNNCNQPIVVETPGTSPIWISTNMTQFGEQELLPGKPFISVFFINRYCQIGILKELLILHPLLVTHRLVM
jgi:hypothetical protein